MLLREGEESRLSRYAVSGHDRIAIHEPMLVTCSCGVDGSPAGVVSSANQRALR